jgi:5-hydroxyisourate hydrolase-like protein (transthyretin family)
MEQDHFLPSFTLTQELVNAYAHVPQLSSPWSHATYKSLVLRGV